MLVTEKDIVEFTQAQRDFYWATLGQMALGAYDDVNLQAIGWARVAQIILTLGVDYELHLS